MSEINTDEMFKKIKKQNGEGVAKVLRSEVLLDIPNLAHILEFAGNDPAKIKTLAPVIREIYQTNNISEYQTDKNPLDLLSEAGYDAFVVTTEEEKNSIKKYYRPGEEICTFRDPHRHENFYMIHAVKRGADKIEPSDHPERDDEYGTSVISIQIAKSGGFISIKNRYNHTVNNPDATFNNNPDNIIYGLSDSLKKHFNVEFNTTKNILPDHYRMVNDQIVYFNYEIDNVYFGPDYYFSGSTITKLNKDYELMLDYFILNTKNGELKHPTNYIWIGTTRHILQNMIQNKKITVRVNKDNKQEHMIFADDVHVLSVENGTITEMNLPDLQSIGDHFLEFNQNLKKLYAPNLKTVDENFLASNQALTELDLPSLESAGYSFVHDNKQISKLNAPKLERVDRSFLQDNQELTELDLPSLKFVDKNFVRENIQISKLNAPSLESVGDSFLQGNQGLTELDLPSLKCIDNYFMQRNQQISKLNAPNLERIGDGFLSKNEGLTELDLPSLKFIGKYFLSSNAFLEELHLPQLEKIGLFFMQQNKKLRTFYAPKLQQNYAKYKNCYGDCFLPENTELTDFVVANKSDCLNKRLYLIIAKNKINQKLKNALNHLTNTGAVAHNTRN
ncbi:MAG: hypothetical protein IJ560_01390 [Alphaproteobacteria bacterium]|nr:hypothetical protein [Alphaproteobacteria bacterium]